MAGCDWIVLGYLRIVEFIDIKPRVIEQKEGGKNIRKYDPEI